MIVLPISKGEGYCDAAVRTQYVLPVTSPVSHLTQTSFTTHSVQYIRTLVVNPLLTTITSSAQCLLSHTTCPSVHSHGLHGLDDHICAHWHFYLEVDELWGEWAVNGVPSARLVHGSFIFDSSLSHTRIARSVALPAHKPVLTRPDDPIFDTCHACAAFDCNPNTFSCPRSCLALEMSIDLSFLLPSTYGPWAYRYAMG